MKSAICSSCKETSRLFNNMFYNVKSAHNVKSKGNKEVATFFSPVVQKASYANPRLNNKQGLNLTGVKR